MDESRLWELPGPKRWLNEVTDGIVDRHFVFLQVPTVIGPVGLMEVLANQFHSRITWLDSCPLISVDSVNCPTDYKHFISSLSKWTGVEFSSSDLPQDVMRKLGIDKSGASGIVIIVDARQVSDQEIEQFSRVVSDFGSKCNSLDSRFGVVTIGRLSSPMSVNVSRHRQMEWSGVLSPIDTYLYVRERARDLDRKVIYQDEILLWTYVELCRFDLDFADLLIDHSWSGSISKDGVGVLNKALTIRRAELMTLDQTVVSKFKESGMMQPWGSERSLSKLICIDSDSSISPGVLGAIWRAQVREMFPRLEEMRAAIIQWAIKLDKKSFIFAVTDLIRTEGGEVSGINISGSDQDFESAEILFLARSARRFPEVTELLHDMRRIRNNLAHQSVVGLRDWRRLEKTWVTKHDVMNQRIG